jgi:hypothetical protein
MNTKRNRRLIDAQLATETVDANFVKDTEFGSVRKSTFSINVKDENGKELYSNKEESYEFDVVNSLANVLRHAGAKLDDAAVTALGKALRSNDPAVDTTIGEATQEIVKTYNNKLKADAKSSAYQGLVNKYKPLEGEKKESAQARLVANFIKLAGVSKEVAINQLKAASALPAEYTVADFDSTPLRRTKGDDSEE